MTASLQITDSAAAENAVAERVSLKNIEEAIGGIYYTTGHTAVSQEIISTEHLSSLRILTICLIVMKNGFTVIGKSAPASAANFNADLGKKFSYEDAIRQIWPLMGFSLRDKLYQDSKHPDASI